MSTFGDVNAAIEAMRAKRDEARQLADAAPELLDALKSLNDRLHTCIRLNVSAQDAYDSFYQEIVAEAISKATGSAE